MDTRSLIQIPGYRYNEYRLILNPHEELRNKIMQLKKEFGEKYKAPVAFYSKPNIALVSFIQLDMMEDKIVNSLKTIAMGYAPFKVELKDYGSYPSHTIYINIESKMQVQNLIRELRSAQRLMTINKENKAHFLDNPNITIAGKLAPWQYEQAWLEYSHRHFTGRFIADCMLLIRRRIEEKAYQIVQRFDFMNLPVTTKQGELFI